MVLIPDILMTMFNIVGNKLCCLTFFFFFLKVGLAADSDNFKFFM